MEEPRADVIHSTPSLRGRGFHTRRIRRRRHLVHHGRVLVLVAVLSISSVLLSVRVSDFVLFFCLGFHACGFVGLDVLRLAHIVGVCPAHDGKPVLELFGVVHHLLVHVILLLPVSSCEFVTFFPSCWTPTASL